MKRMMVMAAVILAMAVSGGCTRIGPGHVGIKVSNAGSDRGVDKDAVTTGWVFYNPLSTAGSVPLLPLK